MNWLPVPALLIPLATALATPSLALDSSCIEQGTRIRTPSGFINVENLTPGDPVHAVVGDHLEVARVESRQEVRPEEYLEIFLAGRKRTLCVTEDHLIQVERGVFRPASELRGGELVYVWTGATLRPVTVQSVARIKAVRPAYNLLVSSPGTFLANGVAVRNKAGP